MTAPTLAAELRNLVEEVGRLILEELGPDERSKNFLVHQGATELSNPTPIVPYGLIQREAARAAGFTGDVCDGCGSFTMRRSGTCLVCTACGTTTGCS